MDICITSCFGDGFLGATLDSVFNQTIENYRVVLVVSNVPQGQVETIPGYGNRRVFLQTFEDLLSSSEARNKALDAVMAPYVAFLDGDDLWHPSKLQMQIAVMKEKNYDFVATDFIVSSNPEAELKSLTLKNALAQPSLQLVKSAVPINDICFSSALLRSSVLSKKRFSSIRMRNDQEYWNQLFQAGHIAYVLKQPLTIYRSSLASLSSNKLIAAYYEWVLYRQYLKFPLGKSLSLFAIYFAVKMVTYFKRNRIRELIPLRYSKKKYGTGERQ